MHHAGARGKDVLPRLREDILDSPPCKALDVSHSSTPALRNAFPGDAFTFASYVPCHVDLETRFLADVQSMQADHSILNTLPNRCIGLYMTSHRDRTWAGRHIPDLVLIFLVMQWSAVPVTERRPRSHNTIRCMLPFVSTRYCTS